MSIFLFFLLFFLASSTSFFALIFFFSPFSWNYNFLLELQLAGLHHGELQKVNNSYCLLLFLELSCLSLLFFLCQFSLLFITRNCMSRNYRFLRGYILPNCLLRNYILLKNNQSSEAA